MGAGSWQCEALEAPSIVVTRLPGLFRDRDEAKYIATRLRPLLHEELPQGRLRAPR